MTAEPSEQPIIVTEADIDAVIHEARGDYREAIRNLLHDVAPLAFDLQTDVSRGYVRSSIVRLRRSAGRNGA